MNVLAIDQGTTSTRALLLSSDGHSRITRVVEHRQSYPKPGWVEHDAEELLANVVACAGSAGPVDAIGIDNQGESCLAWDAETGEALSPVIVWQDSRTQAVIEQLRASGHDAMVIEKSGLPLDAYFSASKLAWLYRTLPEARRLHALGRLRLGTTDAFFLQRLTGRCVTDVTTASRTSLMKIASGEWDTELCALFGVPADTLPDIVSTTGEFGVVSVAGRTVPLLASVVDQVGILLRSDRFEGTRISESEHVRLAHEDINLHGLAHIGLFTVGIRECFGKCLHARRGRRRAGGATRGWGCNRTHLLEKPDVLLGKLVLIEREIPTIRTSHREGAGVGIVSLDLAFEGAGSIGAGPGPR